MKWLDRARERRLDQLIGPPDPRLHKGDRVFVGGIVWCYGTLDIVTDNRRSWLIWCDPRNTPLWAGTNAIYRTEQDALCGIKYTES